MKKLNTNDYIRKCVDEIDYLFIVGSERKVTCRVWPPTPFSIIVFN